MRGFNGSGMLHYAAGLFFGLLLAMLAVRQFVFRRGMRPEYDERQQLVRGRGYMYGFYSCVLAAAAVMVVDMLGLSFAERPVAAAFIFMTGLLIQVSYCILNDGYYGLNMNRKRYGLVLAFAGAVNLFASLRLIREGRLIENGMLSTPAISLMCVVLFLAIGAELLFKQRTDRPDDAADEDADRDAPGAEHGESILTGTAGGRGARR